MLAHDIGDEVLLDVDALSRCNAVSGFCPVNNEESVGFLVNQHFFELCEFKPRVTSVSEGDKGLRRVFHDDVDHPTFVVSNDDGTHEDGHAVFAGCLEPRECRNGRFNRTLDVLSGALRLDVCSLAVLVLEHGPCVRNLSVGWDDQRHQFGSKSLHFPKFFQSEFEAQTTRCQLCIVRHGLAPVVGQRRGTSNLPHLIMFWRGVAFEEG